VIEKIVHAYANGDEQAAQWMDTWACLVAGQHAGVAEISLVPADRHPLARRSDAAERQEVVLRPGRVVTEVRPVSPRRNGRLRSMLVGCVLGP
jgi:hypothetical protein